MRDTEEAVKADQQDTLTEVRLSGDEVANITWHTMSVSTKKCSKVKILRNLESSSSFARRTLQAQAKVREEVWSRRSWRIVDPELRDG